MQKNKTRDMIRSILPSKAVKGARHSRTTAHRANRKMVRQTLHQYNADDLDDEDQMVLRLHESDFKRRRDIRQMVRDRREADKINHFVRWCNKKTAHLPDDALQEKYYYISSLIGGSRDIIREHALGHFILPYRFNAFAYSWRRNYRPAAPLFDRAAFSWALHWTWEHCPKKLNRALKHSSHGIWGSALLWRKCRDEDDCTGSYTRKKWVYSYQNTYGWGFRTSSYQPREGDYRPGTLNKQLVEELIHTHDDRLCPNRIIVNHPDDLDHILDNIFHHGRIWNKRIGEKRYICSDTSELVARLLKLFIDQHLLEDRS